MSRAQLGTYWGEDRAARHRHGRRDADFNGGWMRRSNDEHGATPSAEMVTSWDDLYELTRLADLPAFWEWARNHSGLTVFRHPNHTFRWLDDQRLPAREVHCLHDRSKVDRDVCLDDSSYRLGRVRRGGRVGWPPEVTGRLRSDETRV